jgi:uncharacterized protein YjbJ (UPF0337 family)
VGDVKSSLGDAKSSLGDAKSSLGDAKSLVGDVKSSLGDAKSLVGDVKSSLGDAKTTRCRMQVDLRFARANIDNLMLETAKVSLSLGFGKPHLKSRANAAARLDLEVSAGWASPYSHGLSGGDALLLSTGAAGN